MTLTAINTTAPTWSCLEKNHLKDYLVNDILSILQIKPKPYNIDVFYNFIGIVGTNIIADSNNTVTLYYRHLTRVFFF